MFYKLTAKGSVDIDFLKLVIFHSFKSSAVYNFRNVPYDWINKQKSNQHWLKKEGEKFIFPGGGTMFPNGVGKYVDLMQDMIPEMKDGTIRTAIDTGCGVSFFIGNCKITILRSSFMNNKFLV